MSWRTRYHDDPSGARVAIFTTVCAACTGTARATASSASRNAAAHLFDEQVIHPPLQPACATLGHEIRKAVFGGRPPRVERERPVEEIEELPPVLGAHGHRFRVRHEGRHLPPPGDLHRPFEVLPGPRSGSSHRLGTPPLEGD